MGDCVGLFFVHLFACDSHMLGDLSSLFIAVALLYGTAELLLKASISLAQRIGLTKRVIGLTIVAFGTSAPEIFVCVVAALEGRQDIAMGNVLGSNIANIGLVLGGAALIRPIHARRRVLTRDMPLMLAATVGMLVMAMDGLVGRLDGALLLLGLSVFVVSSIRGDRGYTATGEVEPVENRVISLPVALCLLLLALVGIAYAASLLVNSAVAIGQKLGVPDLLIGLTVVAIGTSLPEAATTWLASIRRHEELGLGNVVGSNIYNIGAVLGLTAILRPLRVSPSSLRIDMPAALLFGVALIPILATSGRVRRREGLLLIVGYLSYVALTYGANI